MYNDCSNRKKPGQKKSQSACGYSPQGEMKLKRNWSGSACGLKWWWLKGVSFAHFVQTFEHMVRVSPKTLEGTHASERHGSLITISFMEGAVAVGTGTCGNYRKRTIPQKKEGPGKTKWQMTTTPWSSPNSPPAAAGSWRSLFYH